MGRTNIIYEKRICEECNKEFEVNIKSKKRFCTHVCSSTNTGKKNAGRKFSEEVNKKKGLSGELNPFYGKHHNAKTKEKISEANTGRKFSEEVNKKKGLSGELNPFYGKIHSDESKAKISDNHRNCIGINNPMYEKGYKIKGEKNGSWQSGSSLIEYGDSWTEELKTNIRKRDHFTCAICHKQGYTVHHIDYNKHNHNEKNLITLCISDHAKTNFNRESWIEFFKPLMNKIYEQKE